MSAEQTGLKDILFPIFVPIILPLKAHYQTSLTDYHGRLLLSHLIPGPLYHRLCRTPRTKPFHPLIHGPAPPRQGALKFRIGAPKSLMANTAQPNFTLQGNLLHVLERQNFPELWIV